MDGMCINNSDYYVLIMKNWNGVPNKTFSSHFKVEPANSAELSHRTAVKIFKEVNKALLL